jgi:hypothetical protein
MNLHRLIAGLVAVVTAGISVELEHHWGIGFWQALAIQSCALVGLIGVRVAIDGK